MPLHGPADFVIEVVSLESRLRDSLFTFVYIARLVVRGILHPFSRRQMINAKIMQAKQEKLAPELKKLTEQYGDDFNRLNAEKMKLYREHGINPLSALLPLLRF